MAKAASPSGNGKAKVTKKSSNVKRNASRGRLTGCGTTSFGTKPNRIVCKEAGGGAILFMCLKPKKAEHAYTRPQEEEIHRNPDFASDCGINDVLSFRQHKDSNVPVPQSPGGKYDAKIFLHIAEKDEDVNNPEYRRKMGTNLACKFTEFANVEGNGFEYETSYVFHDDATEQDPLPLCHLFLDEDIKGIVNAIWMDVDYDDLLEDETTKYAIFGDRTDGGNILKR